MANTQQEVNVAIRTILQSATNSAMQLGGTVAQHVYSSVELYCARVACTQQMEDMLLEQLTALGFPY